MSTREPCPRIEALSALCDGEQQERERIAVEAHVEQCAICAPVLADLRQLRTRFAALNLPTPAFDVAPAVDRRIGAGASATHGPTRLLRRPRVPWWQLAVLAPGGAVAVAIGLWLGAALMPVAVQRGHAIAAQMVPFSPVPTGALCPAPQACLGIAR